MSLFEATGAPERLRFFDGQRLFASDLDGLEAFHREMRRLHLSTLHEPGIAAGFAVAGEEGDRTVRIGPGYAIDDLGREIVLVEEHAGQSPSSNTVRSCTTSSPPSTTRNSPTPSRWTP